MVSIMRTKRTREALLRRLSSVARQALFGTLSQTYRTCGRAGCRCHQGHKHGPHLYVSFRGPDGTTTGYYVPQAVAEATRQGVAAWQELQRLLRELAELNRQRLGARRKGAGRSHGSSSARAKEHLRNGAARRGQALGRHTAAHR